MSAGAEVDDVPEKGKGKGKGKEKGEPKDSLVCNIVWPMMVKSEAQLDALRKLPFRADDVIVATYPKCGTHWVHKICTLILKGGGPSFPMEFNPWDLEPAWQGKGEGKGSLRHEDIPSPRAFATHVPWDFLPQAILDLNCPIVYVMRDPADVLVSYYHFSITNPALVTPESLEAFAAQFLTGASTDRSITYEGRAPFGGLADHYLRYVEAARSGRNIHLMSYERLTASPQEEITRLAKFLGKEIGSSEAASIAEQSSFKSMKAEAEEKDKEAGFASAHIFYRKGETGSAEKELPPELAEKASKAFEEPLGHLAKDFWKL
mmetsp:Transcript_70463/g.147535  ORF Transcript_70463/g.147535 Transcript_70463/m.147535 type:complete len:319 (-) Transcript_70463:69-1025(-)